ncbi:hypothetical protein F4680DRAFT_467295 [Xylaria scruposa]|nr:hypothetical protein F4680DRAFT_467295 [Xylaria scruposa]
MSSSTSSHVSPLSYDPVRSVSESSTTYKNSFLFDSATSAVAKFPHTELYGIIKREESAEQARRQAMMAEMDWISRHTVSSTHPKAEPESPLEGTLDWIPDYAHNNLDENVPHYPANYAYGDPRYDQENELSPNAINYKHGLPIDDNVYDNGAAPIHSQHSHADYHPYGSIIIPHEITPLQDSLLNSAPTVFPPSIQSEALYPQEYMYGAYSSSRIQQTPPPNTAFPLYPQAENHHPIAQPQSYAEMIKEERIWEGRGVSTWVPQEIVRPKSPEIKIEPDEENAYSYHYFISSYAPKPQPMEIMESIESDDVESHYPLEPIQHIKQEWDEYYSDSSAWSTTGTLASTSSSFSTSSSMTSYDADDVKDRYLEERW